MLHQPQWAVTNHRSAEKRGHNMFTAIDMKALQDRLDAITDTVEEAQAVPAVEPEPAPEVEVAEVTGDAELEELKDIMGRSGVMGIKF